MNTVSQVRESFWNYHPEYRKHYRKTYRQNQYDATIRTAWGFYVDMLAHGGLISEKLAKRATL